MSFAKFDLKLVTMATSLKQLEKEDRFPNYDRIPNIWWENRENQSTRFWDSW